MFNKILDDPIISGALGGVLVYSGQCISELILAKENTGFGSFLIRLIIIIIFVVLFTFFLAWVSLYRQKQKSRLLEINVICDNTKFVFKRGKMK